MKRNSSIFRIAFFVLIVSMMLVSCADSVDGNHVARVGVSVSQNNKGLASNFSTFKGTSATNYYWRYKTSSTDAPVSTQTLVEKNWGNAENTPTNADLDTLTIQLDPTYKWVISLFAYTGPECNPEQLAFTGESVEFNPNELVNGKVYVPMNFKDDDAIKGTLLVNSNLERVHADSAKDANYTFTTYTSITSIDGTKVDSTPTNTDWFTPAEGPVAPGLYVATVRYDSLGVYYEAGITVGVHSNIVTSVDGTVEGRYQKEFTVHYHNGRVIDSVSGVDLITDTDEYDSETFLFEEGLVLATASDMPEREGLEFIGWYTSDADFSTETNSTATAMNAKYYVTTKTSAEIQEIFVADEADADEKFIKDYALTTDSNGVYQRDIHLYARWKTKSVSVGITTRARDVLNLFDTKFMTHGNEAYASVTINNGEDKVTGFATTMSDFVVYADKDGKVVPETSATHLWYVAGFETADKTLILDEKGNLSGTYAGVTYFAQEDIPAEQISKGDWYYGTDGGERVDLQVRWALRKI